MIIHQCCGFESVIRSLADPDSFSQYVSGSTKKIQDKIEAKAVLWIRNDLFRIRIQL